MKSKTKLTVCIVAMLLLTAIAILGVVVVFSAEQQNFVSNISVKYVSKEVIGSASARYAVGGFSGATSKPMTTESGTTEITFAPNQPASSTLSPKENLEIAEPGQFVMLEYDFTNETAHPVGLTLTYEDVDADDENIKISTMTTPLTEYLSVIDYLDYIAEVEEMANIMCIDKFTNTLSTTILPNSKLTIWVLVQVDNIGRDSTFSGNFTFNLDGTVEDYTETFTYATNGEYATITGVAQGTMADFGELMGEENMGIPFVLLDGPELNIKAGYEYNGLPVKTIGAAAFMDQINISSITSFGDVETLGYTSFLGSGLTGTLTIPGTVKNIIGSFGSIAISSLTLQNGIENIGFGAFSGCEALTEVTIPESVETIGDSAFGYCSSLRSVTIGSGVTTIGPGAFSGCKALTEVIIPESVTTIGNGAFFFCNALNEVIIDSPTIYKILGSSTDDSDLTGYLKSGTGKVKVLASIDDGSNEYLKTSFTKEPATETIGGKQYNVYTKK